MRQAEPGPTECPWCSRGPAAIAGGQNEYVFGVTLLTPFTVYRDRAYPRPLVGHGPSGPTGTFVRRSARSLGEVISTDQIIKIVKYLVISAGFKGKAYLHLCVASLFVSRES